MKIQSRLVPQVREYDGIPVAIQEIPESLRREIRKRLVNPMATTPVWLVADVEADDELAAMSKIGAIFEPLLDLLSFDLGAPLSIGQVEVLDITPPVAAGDKREFSIYVSSPFSIDAESVEMQAIQGRPMGELPRTLELGGSRPAAALRWFTKALGTARLYDQFIFLWIALEILCDESSVQVAEPYRNQPCGHLIEQCPECGEPTAKGVRGKTIKAFLETLGVDAAEARKLWSMRQLMHGHVRFDSREVEHLPALVQVLRATVGSALKPVLEKDVSDFPHIASAGLSIQPAGAVSGTHEIEAAAIKPLSPAESDPSL